MRNMKREENRIYNSLIEISIYIIFIFFLFCVSTFKQSSRSFYYQSALRNVIKLNQDQYKQIKTPEKIWSWMKTDFLDGMKKDYWYNVNDSTGLATALAQKGFLADSSSYLIGKILLRQLRIKNGNFLALLFS